MLKDQYMSILCLFTEWLIGRLLQVLCGREEGADQCLDIGLKLPINDQNMD